MTYDGQEDKKRSLELKKLETEIHKLTTDIKHAPRNLSAMIANTLILGGIGLAVFYFVQRPQLTELAAERTEIGTDHLAAQLIEVGKNRDERQQRIAIGMLLKLWPQNSALRMIANTLEKDAFRRLAATFAKLPAQASFQASDDHGGQSFVRLILSERVLFDDTSAQVRKRSQGLLISVASAIERHVPDAQVTVTGYADVSESDPYTMDLSRRHGLAVARALLIGGLPAAQISVVVAGERQPLGTGDISGRRQQHRRVEFVISPSLGNNLQAIGAVPLAANSLAAAPIDLLGLEPTRVATYTAVLRGLLAHDLATAIRGVDHPSAAMPTASLLSGTSTLAPHYTLRPLSTAADRRHLDPPITY